MSNTGKQAKRTGADFTQFNRVMFSATAFVGMFSFAMNRMTTSIMEAARLDRVINQYEKTIGPKGELIQMVRSLTDTSIDYFEAMRASISLKSLGIVKDTRQIAEILARSGVAAKMAGKDSAEGMRVFTQFLKDGSLSHLEQLNLLSRSNKAFKLQQSILGRHGGVMGGVLSLSQRLSVGMAYLRATTEANMKGNRDYLDTLQDVGIFSRLAGQEIKTLALKAFTPLLEKVVDASISIQSFVENINKTHPEIIFLAKSIGVATVAVTGLFAAIGTLRLSIIALGAAGIGIPGLTAMLGAGALAFMGITHGADSFTERLKIFGGVFKGTFQLVNSFLSDPENFAKGIGEMDESLANLLRKHGLLELVTQISRVTASVTLFGKGVLSGFRDGIQFIIDKVGGVSKKFMQLLGIDPGDWSRFWVEGIENVGKAIGKIAVGVLAAVAAFKGFKLLRGLFKKIPGVGKVIGGGSAGRGGRGGGPLGTADDPLYVILSNDIFTRLSALFAMHQSRNANAIKSALLTAGPMKNVTPTNLLPAATVAGTKPVQATLGMLSRFGSSIGKLATKLRTVAGRLIIFALVAGAAKGVYENFDKIKNVAGTLYDVLKVKVVGGLAWIGDKFKQFGDWVGNIMTSVTNFIKKIPGISTVMGWTKDFFDEDEKLDKDTSSTYLLAKSFALATKDLMTDPIDSTAKVTGMAIGGISDFADEKGRQGFLASETARALMSNQMPMMLDTGATPESRMLQLQATQEKLEGEKKVRFAEAMMQAQDKMSASGKVISAEEYEKIMRYTLGEAVGFLRDPLERTANNTVRSEATSTAKRGC